MLYPSVCSVHSATCSSSSSPQKSAQTVLRGCEEPCGSPRVRTISGSRMPPLLSRLSETSSADESMSEVDSIPCSPLMFPCSPPGAPGKSPVGTSITTFIHHHHVEQFQLMKLIVVLTMLMYFLYICRLIFYRDVRT